MAAAAGLKVHVYTSPHLVRFAERIALDGRQIDESALAAILAECEAANAGRPITFFEITTAAAFLAFARAPADLVVLETGLGGRFDATNVIARPAVTAITPISLDHLEFLGDTVAKIAFEKAGILKPGIPAVIGDQPAAAMAVLEARAAALGAPLYRSGTEWTASPTETGMTYFEAAPPPPTPLPRGEGENKTPSPRGRGLGEGAPLPTPSLPGPHQVGNAGIAIACARILGLPMTAIACGLETATWPARLQRLTGTLARRLPPGWTLWLDGGHNAAAGEVLAVQAARWTDAPLDLVCGMLKTKDAAGFLRPLAPHVRRLRTISIPGEPNGLPADALAAVARDLGIAAEAAPGLDAALDALTKNAPVAGRILVCGSLYLAGAVLATDGEG
jgi:dihydrofolate synthase/folylpolyglutamate synthase